MRLSSIFILTGTFLAAAVGSMVAAGFAVDTIENASETNVRRSLDQSELGWAEVRADGLQVRLSGIAPTEALRFRAKSVASSVVEASRVIDRMQVQASSALAAPDFSIEILRNEGEISLIGLIPAETDRAALVDRVSKLRGVENVSDLLQSADYPVPAGWSATVSYAVNALRNLPHSKISLSSDRVSITAMSDSPEAKRALEADLRRRADPDMRLMLSISAPRPIIAPFTLRFVRDAEGARFDACSADTERASRMILDAGRVAGMEAPGRCVIGLGVPSSDWGRATSMAVRAVGELGGGSVTVSDADISLIAAEGTTQADFDRVVGELENGLPEVYALHTVLPKMPDASPSGTPEFTATLSPEGKVQLRGRVSDEVMRNATESLAKARFGSDSVYTAARLDETLPEGWPVRVLTSLDALSLLANGAVTVTPDSVDISGNTGNQDASNEIARMFGSRLGEGAEFQINVTYQEKLDPLAALPTPEECLALLKGVQKEAKINFEPGSANVTGDSRGLLDQIAEVLKTCPELPLQIAGFTDSQGREEMNLALSESRAQAVLNELRTRRVLTSSFAAEGFGEADPIADNGTEEGREANRRIEFRLQATADDDAGTAPGMIVEDGLGGAHLLGDGSDVDVSGDEGREDIDGSGDATDDGSGDFSGDDMGEGSDAGEDLPAE
jgi:OmpA-OmpF porin, OOP family